MPPRKDHPGKSRKTARVFAPKLRGKLRGPKVGTGAKRTREPERVTAAERVRRHRETLRAKGLRPLTLWIPDTRSPAFLTEAARQCRLANAADRTDPTAAFADHLADELLRDLDESGL